MQFTINAPLDMHLHLREAEMLQLVAPLSAAHFAGAVVMPNLQSPVDSQQKLRAYRHAIIEAAADDSFTPYMTLFFRPYTRAELETVRDHIIGIKLYPAGITTQSEAGVADFESIGETVAIMEELQIPLLVHGESNGFVMEREREFLAIYRWLAKSFPRLAIIMEHITTADTLDILDEFPNVAATVTLHHLMLTLDDVVGGLMQPHLFCKPIAKTPHDLQALRAAVFNGHPRILFGSDSAPHPTHAKECCGCAAGVFSAPVALPKLVELFAAEDRLEVLPDFVTNNAQRFYGITPNPKKVHIQDEAWTVPLSYGSVRPFLAGEKIRWKVAAIEK